MTTPRRKQYLTEIEPTAARRLTFKVSTGALDRDRDRIDPAGWDLTAYRKNPVILWAHNYNELPVAKAVDVGPWGGALLATAEFARHEFAETVLDLYTNGFLNAVSVGFIPHEQVPNDEGGWNVGKAELLEFSCVPVPANSEALRVLSAKGITAWRGDVADALDPDALDWLLRELGVSERDLQAAAALEELLAQPEQLAVALGSVVGEVVAEAVRARLGQLPP